MKRAPVLFAIALVAGLSTLMFRSADASKASARPAVSGTYFITFDVPGIGPLNAIATGHPDGTLMVADQTDFGLGGADEMNTVSQGVWFHTGARQTLDARIHFGFDASGMPNGTVTRVTAVTDWDAGFHNGTGQAFRKIYDLTIGEDPTDPNQGVDAGVFSFTVRRLRVD